MNSLTHKNIFVIFAPGSGGNHLANLLSTDKNLTSRFNSNDYNDNSDRAHYFDTTTLEKDKINLKEILKNPGVYASHLFQLLTYRFITLVKKQFVILTIPKWNSQGHNRMKSLYNTYNNSYFYLELKWLYTEYNFKKLYNIQDKCIEINGQDLFEDNNFINNLFEKCKELNINLDKDLCYQAHRLWLSKISKDL